MLLDPQDRVLMIKIEDDAVREGNSDRKQPPFWVTPGGGIKPGESIGDALGRELFEETGMTRDDAEIGPCLWHGQHMLNWCGVPTICYDSFYIARVKQDVRVTTEHMEEAERSVYRAHRWWSLKEIKSSGEIFLPKNFAALLDEVIKCGVPGEAKEIDLTNPSELSG